MERDVVYVARRQRYSMIYERWIVSWASGCLAGLRLEREIHNAFLFVEGTVFGKRDSPLFFPFFNCLLSFILRLFSSPPFNNGSMNEFRLSLDSSSFHLNTLLSHLLNNTFLYSVFFGNLDFNRSFNSESGNLLFMFTLLIAVSVVQTDR